MTWFLLREAENFLQSPDASLLGVFRLFPLLTNLHLLFTTRGQIYNTYIRAVMLYSSETWSLTTPSRLKRNHLAMIRWICKARVEDRISAEKLHAKLGIQNIESALRCHKLRWFGHVVRSSGWLSKLENSRLLVLKDPVGQKWRGKSCWRRIRQNSVWLKSTHTTALRGRDLFLKKPYSAEENGLWI